MKRHMIIYALSTAVLRTHYRAVTSTVFHCWPLSHKLVRMCLVSTSRNADVNWRRWCQAYAVSSEVLLNMQHLHKPAKQCHRHVFVTHSTLGALTALIDDAYGLDMVMCTPTLCPMLSRHSHVVSCFVGKVHTPVVLVHTAQIDCTLTPRSNCSWCFGCVLWSTAFATEMRTAIHLPKKIGPCFCESFSLNRERCFATRCQD